MRREVIGSFGQAPFPMREYFGTVVPAKLLVDKETEKVSRMNSGSAGSATVSLFTEPELVS